MISKNLVILDGQMRSLINNPHENQNVQKIHFKLKILGRSKKIDNIGLLQYFNQGDAMRNNNLLNKNIIIYTKHM